MLREGWLHPLWCPVGLRGGRPLPLHGRPGQSARRWRRHGSFPLRSRRYVGGARARTHGDRRGRRRPDGGGEGGLAALQPGCRSTWKRGSEAESTGLLTVGSSSRLCRVHVAGRQRDRWLNIWPPALLGSCTAAKGCPLNRLLPHLPRQVRRWGNRRNVQSGSLNIGSGRSRHTIGDRGQNALERRRWLNQPLHTGVGRHR